MDMNRSLAVVCLVAALLATTACDRAEEPSEFAPPRTSWVYPIAIPSSHADELRPAAERLAKLLELPTTPWIADQNPGCAFWLRVDGVVPNPGDAGYVIVIQPGGATITASNIKQLDAAIDKIESLRSAEGEDIYLPVGLITSYPIAHADIDSASGHSAN